jgi:predicted RNase H-like nuclease (RuvC/YqgF family)
MTAQPGGDKPPGPAEVGPGLPSWRRLGEFIRNVLSLEHTVEVLKKDNRELHARLNALQRQFDDQAGQLKTLMEFVRGALDDRIEGRIRRALEERDPSAAKLGRKGAPRRDG